MPNNALRALRGGRAAFVVIVIVLVTGRGRRCDVCVLDSNLMPECVRVCEGVCERALLAAR